ncbi:tyrosine-type recombinase/integrase [Kordiimonas sp.]|uniref:tyrosine-type recombinase/integrase n=1 Tax=Kordiimonas sp. TaxID=1970157 RepID=UPI003A913BAB
MATLGTRRGRIYIDFRYKGVRYREQTDVLDNVANRRKAEQLLKRMEAEMTLGTFDYIKYFPQGRLASKFAAQQKRTLESRSAADSVETFADVWFTEREVEWRQSYRDINRITLDRYIIPYFKGKKLDEIDKAMILQFRAHLANQPGHGTGTLSASRVNHIMIPLRMILAEAAERYGFKNPWVNIKRLKEAKSKVDPFTLQEVQAILETVRPDFKPYYIVRFFTGLRSSEIDGLQWKYVDFERRQILIRQALVQGRLVGTKTDGSSREVDMCSQVQDCLKHMYGTSPNKTGFVFCTRDGTPLHNRNVTQRVWYPLLRHLALTKRRPYQTRHTAATLWLAAGENPEWIARQMGHSNTKMLFEVYSRYVPNLTRRDGSAFEQLLKAEFGSNSSTTDKEAQS